MDIKVILTFLGIAAAMGGIVYTIGARLLKSKPAATQELRKVAEVTIHYFRESGVEAKVDCVYVDGKGLVALIEVDPQVRFRSSYIIEQTLKDQILRLTGKHLSEVFWRFPMVDKLVDASHAGAAYTASKTKPEDTQLDIGEVSWDEYERAMAEGEKNIRKDSD